MLLFSHTINRLFNGCGAQILHSAGPLETGASARIQRLEAVEAELRSPKLGCGAGTRGSSSRVAPVNGGLQLGTCWKLCEIGRVSEAVEALCLLVQGGCHIPSNFFYRLIKRCIGQKDLVLGRRVHALSVTCGYEGNAFLANHLICMYASHGRLEEATQVFSKVTLPSAHMWASIIFAYARHGEPAQAILLYRQMRESGVTPDNHVFVAVLKACASVGDLAVGKDVHSHIRASAVKPDIFVQTCLVDMYAKCGSLKDAQRLFDRVSQKNTVTWTAMIAGYAHHGMGQEALGLYGRMQQEDISPPDSVTFVSLLQACASVGARGVHQGRQLHAHIQERGLQDDVLVGAGLVHMYSKCGSLKDAHRVFERLSQKTIVTWTSMIAGYTQQGMGREALSLYSIMQQENITLPDSVTFVCLLQACASLGSAGMHQGKHLHAQIQERGLQNDVVVGASLVNMYSKCGSMQDAQRLFDMLSKKNVVTWNTMFAGYARQGLCHEALNLYSSMQEEGMTSPDSASFVSLLQACASVAALHHGKQLHAQIEDRGLLYDVDVGASLIHMYGRCGHLADAQRVFDGLSRKDVVTWTAMIAGYAEQGMGHEALSLYSMMRQEGITQPDATTFVCLLQACATVAALSQGMQLRAEIEERGMQADVVIGNSLVNMYAKCGSLEDAQRVFDELSKKDVVTWSAMIAGYAQVGMGQEALGLYSSMQQEGMTPPNSFTFSCLVHACASVAALPLGKQLHALIKDRGFEDDVVVGPSLVNMYARCGSLEDAQQVFDSLPERDIGTWGALIAGYARQGASEVVFDMVDKMRVEGIQPDGITFLSLLTVCKHVGLLEKGRKYFEAMTTDYGIRPTIEHYTCMMDLLGRTGHLDEALQMVKNMPLQPNGAVWLTLLAACRTWSNVEVGRQAFEFAVRLDEKDAAAYVLMSNIYVSSQMWDEANEMQARRVQCGARKEQGRSWWTDPGGVMHAFVAGDRKHPESEDIYTWLEQMGLNMKKE